MDEVAQAVKHRQKVKGTMGGLVGTAVGHLRDGFELGGDTCKGRHAADRKQ